MNATTVGSASQHAENKTFEEPWARQESKDISFASVAIYSRPKPKNYLLSCPALKCATITHFDSGKKG